MEENKEFLEDYEIKNWDFSPRIYKIIASAAIFNLLFLVVVGQTNLLQTTACNSPLISKVCSVLDTVYVGSKLLSGDKDYVVKDYNKTEIKDADVVWVDNTGETPQLQYPEGYFQLANREELAMLESLDSQYNNELPFNNSPLPPMASSPSLTPPPPIIPRSNRSIFDTKPKLPKRNKNTVVGNLPDNPLGDGEKNDKNNENTADNKPDEQTDTTQKELENNTAKNSDAVNGVEINKKPLQDFADDIVARWSKKEIDLTKPFTVQMIATLTKDGKLDRKKSRFIGQQGDEDIVNVAKSAIEAVGDSGFLAHLRNLDVQQIEITLIQDGEKLYAKIVSDQKTPEKAKTTASGLRGAISIGKLTISGEDEKVLLDSAKVTSEGNKFIMLVNIPKPVANEMMNRKLQEALVKKTKEEQENQNSPKQPNSTTESKVANNSKSK
ncbi:MAG: hypothetical protein M3405_01155 [Acidobacteriota bacterium]|nr:hypothetical protein [Acidobacteriota bacterium]